MNLNREWAYVAWRFHVWAANGKMSYDDIERLVKRGKLSPFTCECEKEDCPYREVKEERLNYEHYES